MILFLALLTIFKIFVHLILDQTLYCRPMAYPAPFVIQDTTDTTDTGSRKKDPKIVQGMLAFILSKF
jgi:hypothetical protein